MNYYPEDKEDEGIICPNCGGTGMHPYLPHACTTCHGTGMIQDGYGIDHPTVSLKRLKKYPQGCASEPEA